MKPIIEPVCELPHAVVEAWLAKLLPEVSDCDNYFQEHGSIYIGQTYDTARESCELHIWKNGEKYELIYIIYLLDPQPSRDDE